MSDSIQSLRDQLLQLHKLHEEGDLSADAYARRRAELERRLADVVTAMPAAPAAPAPAAKPAPAAGAPRASPRLLAAVAVGVVMVALAGYAWKGSPAALFGGPPAAAPSEAQAPHAVDKAQVAAMVDKLAARLKDKPDDVEGWTMLGRTYMVLEKPAEAVAAYRRATDLQPRDATLLADFADAVAVQQGRNLDGEPMKLVERALAADPDNLKALMLAGTAAFNRDDFAGAARHWERMGRVGPADHPLVQASVDALAEARRRGNLPTPPAAGPAASAAAGATLTGTVTLAAGLAGRAAPQDTVFVFARAAEGPRMPVAILRKQVRDLPLTFRLDDSMAMSPAARISTSGRLVVGARISKSGQAMPQPGDLEGLSAPVAAGASDIRVEISAPVR